MSMESELKAEILDAIKNDSSLASMATIWGTRHVFDDVRDFGRGGRILGRLPLVEVGDAIVSSSNADGMTVCNDILELGVRCHAKESALADLCAKVRNAIESVGVGDGLRHVRAGNVETSVGVWEGTAAHKYATVVVRIETAYKRGNR